MADCARWLVACEPALPWDAGAFLKVHSDTCEQADRDVVEASPIGPHLPAILEKHAAGVDCAPAELLARLAAEANDATGGCMLPSLPCKKSGKNRKPGLATARRNRVPRPGSGCPGQARRRFSFTILVNRVFPRAVLPSSRTDPESCPSPDLTTVGSRSSR